MEIYSSFAQYLETSGIFSQAQAEKFKSNLTAEDENQNVCNLANFFTTITASESYDLAVRLFTNWQKGPKSALVPSSSVSKLSNPSPRRPQSAYKSLAKTIGSQSTRNNNRSLSRDQSECETKSSNHHHSQTSDNVFTFLHNDSFRRNAIKTEIEHQNLLKETAECTFQPNISKFEINENTFNVFNRLQHDLRKEKNEMNQIVKEHLEMQGCTFSPAILKKKFRRDEDEPRSSSRSLNRTFEKLYKEYQVKNFSSVENEILKNKLEVKGCTFTPSLTLKGHRSPSREASEERFQSLHKLHNDKQINLAKKRIEQSADEIKKCTFKPQVWSTPKNRGNSKEVQDRLLKWNTEKILKLEDRVREKICLEESMNRELNLLAKKKNDLNDSQLNGSRYEGLYQDSIHRVHRKEKLEKKILKDIGASFKPKTNKHMMTTPKLRDNALYEDQALEARESKRFDS